MDHKKALLKILKWAGSFLISTLFSAPIIIVLLIGGMVMALFGKSSRSSSDVTFKDSVSVTNTAALICEYFSEAGYTDIQIAAILGNLEWESRLDYNSYTQLKKGGTAMGIAQWTTYSGKNSLELFAESNGMEWNDLELQCMAIDATLHEQNPYSGWYDTGMGRYYGVTKADFWEGDLYDATMSFFCCLEDPEEYPNGCNNHGYVSASGCLSVSFDCGNGHGRYPYAQMYLDNMSSDGLSAGSSYHDEDESMEDGENGLSEEPEGGMDIPLYLQANYTSVPWGDTNLGKSGCGPTCLAMVMTYLTGETVTPPDVIAWSGTTYLAPTGSSWEFFPAAASHYGVGYRSVKDQASVVEALENGYTIIAREQPGSFFSPVGHFIVLRGVTDDGKFLVNDPAGKYPVNREFTWEEIDRPQNFYMIFGE